MIRTDWKNCFRNGAVYTDGRRMLRFVCFFADSHPKIAEKIKHTALFQDLGELSTSIPDGEGVPVIVPPGRCRRLELLCGSSL